MPWCIFPNPSYNVSGLNANGPISNQEDVPGVLGPDPFANSAPVAERGAFRKRLGEDSQSSSAYRVASFGVPAQSRPCSCAEKEPMDSLSADPRKNRVPSPITWVRQMLFSGCSPNQRGRKARGSAPEGWRMLPAVEQLLTQLYAVMRIHLDVN